MALLGTQFGPDFGWDVTGATHTSSGQPVAAIPVSTLCLLQLLLLFMMNNALRIIANVNVHNRITTTKIPEISTANTSIPTIIILVLIVVGLLLLLLPLLWLSLLPLLPVLR